MISKSKANANKIVRLEFEWFTTLGSHGSKL